MRIEPGTCVRPIDAPESWECVQGIDDRGVFIGVGTHVPWPVLYGYWEYKRPASSEWEKFPATAASCLYQLIFFVEAAWVGRNKPAKIQAVIDQAIPLAGLRKVHTDSTIGYRLE